MFVIVVLAVFSLVSGSWGQCYDGGVYLTPFESVFLLSTPGCVSFRLGTFTSSGRITLALTWNQLTCALGQNIQVLDSNSNLLNDLCATGVSNKYIVNTGAFVTVRFINPTGASMSSYLHYNILDRLSEPPSGIFVNISPSTTTQPPIPVTNPTSTPTTLSTTVSTTTTTVSTTTLPSTTTPTTTTASTTQSSTTTTTAPPVIVPPTTPLPSLSCGQAAFQPRITGGISANAFSWPWQVLLYIDRSDGYQTFCSGTLINNQWIVTAAHCATGLTGTAYLGLYDRNNLGASLAIGITRIIQHPGYNANVRNDIALVKLSQPVSYTDRINRVCLTTANLANLGTSAVVTGWGQTSAGGSLANILQQITVPIQPMSWCNAANTDSTTQICAGDKTNGRGPCQGDSGGPMVTKIGNQYFLIGVTSMSDSGCSGIGIYTNVAVYIDWIVSTVRSN